MLKMIVCSSKIKFYFLFLLFSFFIISSLLTKIDFLIRLNIYMYIYLIFCRNYQMNSNETAANDENPASSTRKLKSYLFKPIILVSFFKAR